MEEGKIATKAATFGATERRSMYIRMRVLPWSNTFVSVGQVGINSAPGEEPVVLLVQLNVRGKWKKVR
jgi:hypothetical protein